MGLIVTPAFAGDQSYPTLPPLTEAAAPLPQYMRGSGADAMTGSVAAPPNAFADDFDTWSASHPVGSIANTPTAYGSTTYAAPAKFTSWAGFYVGGQFSFSDANADFSNTTQAPIAYSLRGLTLENEFAPSNWQVLGSASHGTAGFGGFVGYNFQYMNVIMGVEANYDQASLSVLAPNSPISRITGADSQGDNYLVNITGSGTLTNLDFGTLRARAGWMFGNFLPYAFAGVAIGRADLNVTETTSGQQNPPTTGSCSSSSTPPCMPFSFTGTAGKDSKWLYGGTVGVGLDFALKQNIFVRAEYEYIHFTPVASLLLDINTVRVGAGIKF